jgi:surfeit locus 1 family protein
MPVQSRLLWPLIFGVLGTAVLVSLGVWQTQRLVWKEGILADIEARIQAEPVALPADPDPVSDRYLPVQADGLITDEEIQVLVSVKLRGAGYRVISAFETEGRRILVDRGFIGLTDKDAARPAVMTTVLGNLHWPDEVDSFTPEPDLEAGIWFARDVPALAKALNTEPVLLIVRETSDGDQPVSPLPVDTSGIPNDHLEYAGTWFLLALVWVAMTFFYIRRARAKTTES